MISVMENIPALFNNFSFSDSIYAEELQFQEALEASLNTHNSNHASSSQISCEICIEDKEKDEMFQIEGCTHSFCSVCVSKHVEAKLQENIVYISCPGEDCKNIIQPFSLRFIIPPNVITRWEETLSESTILASKKSYCPFCSEILIDDNDDGLVIRESECPVCHKLFCAQCNAPWHRGLDCKKFKRMNKDAKEKKKLRLLARDKQWKECPNCKIYVEKIEGCKHMTCRCKFEFCYACGSKWNEIHWNCQT